MNTQTGYNDSMDDIKVGDLVRINSGSLRLDLSGRCCIVIKKQRFKDNFFIVYHQGQYYQNVHGSELVKETLDVG